MTLDKMIVSVAIPSLSYTETLLIETVLVTHPSSTDPLQLSSILFPQTSVAPGLTAALLSLQSPLVVTHPAGCEHRETVVDGFP